MLTVPKPPSLPPILAIAERHADRQANCQQLAFDVHPRLSAQRSFSPFEHKIGSLSVHNKLFINYGGLPVH